MKYVLSFFLLSITLLSNVFAQSKTSVGFDAELTSFAYPYKVQIYQLESQNQKLKMAYMDVAAPKANGHTVVLLHGKNFSGFYWESTIKFLVELGFRVIVPDQIGFGKSSKPAAYQFTFHTLSLNTKKLLDQLQIKNAVVIGHSMGGMLASRFTLMYPAFVEKLVLVNPIGLEDWRLQAPYPGIDEIYKAELKATPDSIREYQKQAYYAGEWKPDYEKLIVAQSGWTKHADFQRVAWNSALTAEMIYTQPVIYEFSKIKAKTLLIIGQRDRTAVGKQWASADIAKKMGDYPKLGMKVRRLLAHSRLVEFPGVGHMPQVEAYERYKKSITKFLK